MFLSGSRPKHGKTHYCIISLIRQKRLLLGRHDRKILLHVFFNKIILWFWKSHTQSNIKEILKRENSSIIPLSPLSISLSHTHTQTYIRTCICTHTHTHTHTHIYIYLGSVSLLIHIWLNIIDIFVYMFVFCFFFVNPFDCCIDIRR